MVRSVRLWLAATIALLALAACGGSGSTTTSSTPPPPAPSSSSPPLSPDELRTTLIQAMASQLLILAGDVPAMTTKPIVLGMGTNSDGTGWADPGFTGSGVPGTEWDIGPMNLATTPATSLEVSIYRVTSGALAKADPCDAPFNAAPYSGFDCQKANLANGVRRAITTETHGNFRFLALMTDSVLIFTSTASDLTNYCTNNSCSTIPPPAVTEDKQQAVATQVLQTAIQVQ